MKRLFFAMALMLLLSACAAKCPTPPKPMPAQESSLKKFRLAGLVVDGSDRVRQRQDLLQVVAELTKGSFLQPGQPGYESAPAVQVKCVVDAALQEMSLLYFYRTSALIYATFSLVDPRSGDTIFTKQYLKKADLGDQTVPLSCLSNYGKGYGAFFSATNSALDDFGKDIKGVVKKTAIIDSAKFDGTLTDVTGDFINNKLLVLTMILNCYKKFDVVSMAQLDIPNTLQNYLSRKNLFSNASTNIYSIRTELLYCDIGSESFFGPTTISYGIKTILYHNGDSLGEFIHTADKIRLSNYNSDQLQYAESVAKFIEKQALGRSGLEQAELPPHAPLSLAFCSARL